MRLWPASFAMLTLMMAACSAPPQPSVPASPSPSPSVEVSVAPSVEPSPSPSPSPSPTPTPSPSVAASPSPSPSPSGLAEANHGPSPFPSAPGVGAYDLSKAKASAGAGGTTAVGAIDGRIYTEWSARAGIGQNTWLSVDLGEPKLVSKLELLPDASPTTEVSFDVELSTDGTTWKTVARSVLATGSNTAPKWGTASWSTQSARYVRVVPTRWGSSWVAVWEVKVYP